MFSLDGRLIKTIYKNTQDQFQRINLYNDYGIPLGSGIYIIQIEMPDLGITKILKAAVIQAKVIPAHF